MLRAMPRYSRLGAARPSKPLRMGFTGLGSVSPSLVSASLYGSRGLSWSRGLSGTGQDLTMSSLQIGAATLSTASAMGASWATLAIPIVGPIIAGVTVGLSFLFARKGPKQKIATTEIVDKVEPLMVQNLEGYLSGPRTRSSQSQALANFDAGWQFVVDSCNIPEMGEPGQRCTSDRESGACVWRDSSGECWNWFKGYRDPIANDPGVQPDPVEVGGSGSGIQFVGSGLDSQVVVGTGPGAVSLDSKLLLAGAAVVLGLAMSGGGGGGWSQGSQGSRGGFRK